MTRDQSSTTGNTKFEPASNTVLASWVYRIIDRYESKIAVLYDEDNVAKGQVLIQSDAQLEAFKALFAVARIKEEVA